MADAAATVFVESQTLSRGATSGSAMAEGRAGAWRRSRARALWGQLFLGDVFGGEREQETYPAEGGEEGGQNGDEPAGVLKTRALMQRVLE